MSKFIRVFFVMFALGVACTVLYPMPAKAATNYYVSSSSGNDSNNGTSSSTPWRTLAKASTVTYQAGDQLLLKCGDSWNEALHLNGTGTSSTPIVVDSYGTGNSPKIYEDWPTVQPTKVNDNDYGVTYNGSWGYNTGDSQYYNNDYHHSSIANSYVEYTFTGTSVSLISAMAPNCGKIDVYIDNQFQTTLDLYYGFTLPQWCVFGKMGLPNALHTIKVVVSSDKNPSSSGYNVLIDAFSIYSSEEAAIIVQNPSGWKIKNLELYDAIYGIYTNSGENTSYSDFWLEDLYIHDCQFYQNAFNAGDPFPRGIVIGSGDTGTTTSLSDITIKNCILQNCGGGIDISAGGDTNNYNIKNINISGITAVDSGSSPISLGKVENATISDFVTIHGADAYVFVGSCNGFAQNCKNVTFADCEFAQGQRNDCYDGAGFDYEGGNDGVKFDKCLFHDNANSAIMIMNNPTNNSNIEIKNSVFYNNCLDPDPRTIYTPLGEIGLLDINNSGTVYGNRFYINSNVGVKGGQNQYDNGSLDFSNNIVIQESIESNGANLAASVTASVSTNSGTAGNVNDGNTGTLWSATASTDQWIELDFNSSTIINKFYVKEASDSSINRFQMQYWDNTNSVWKSCFNGKGIGPKRVMPIIPVSTTKVRMYIYDTISGNPSISELEVYSASQPVHTDEFDSSTLDSAWSWVREDSANWSLTEIPGNMRITLQGQDIWGTTNTTENILVRNAPTSSDWMISTKLNFSPYTNCQNAGLIVRSDDDNYIILAYGYDNSVEGGLCVSFAKEIGASPTIDKMAFKSNPVYLRITKAGTTYTLEYSNDEINWNTGATFTGIDFASYQVGLIAQNTAGTSADFEWFNFPVLKYHNFNTETTGGNPLGWTLDTSGGAVTVQNIPSSTDKSVRLYDTSTSAKAGMSKTFTTQNDWLKATARVRSEQTGHGCEFELRSGSTRIGCIRLHSDGNIKYIDSAGEHSIQAYSTGTFYKLGFLVNINTNRFDIYVDDVLKASNCSFENSATYIDKINIESWGSTSGTHYVDDVKWVDIPVLVDSNFNIEPTGSNPDGWILDTSGGAVTVQNIPSSTDKSVRLYDTSVSAKTGIGKSFTTQNAWLKATARVRSEQTGHGCEFELRSGSTRIGCIRLHSDGNIKYIDSAGEHSIQAYSTGTFYKLGFLVNTNTNKFDVYVDDVLKASNCSFENSATYIDKINIESWGSTSGTHYVDDIFVVLF